MHLTRWLNLTRSVIHGPVISSLRVALHCYYYDFNQQYNLNVAQPSSIVRIHKIIKFNGIGKNGKRRFNEIKHFDKKQP